MRRWIFILFALASVARAESPLLLSDVVSSVELHFPLVAAAIEEKSVAEADLLSAEGGFDLKLKNRLAGRVEGYYENSRLETLLEKPTPYWGANLFTGYRWGRGNFPLYDDKQRTLEGGEITAGIEVPLWRDRGIDRRRANVSSSEISVLSASYQIEQQKIESVRMASIRYWAWIASGKRLEITRELVARAEERDRGLAERVKRGDVSQFERDDNRRSLYQRSAQLVAAERLFQQSTIELSLYLRGPDGATISPEAEKLPAVFSEPTGDDSYDLQALALEAVAKRPEIERNSLLLKQNEIENSWAGNQRAPRLDFSVQVSKDVGSSDPTKVPTEIEGSIFLEIPLERRTADGRLAAARANELRLSALRRMAKDRIFAEVKDAVSAIDTNRRKLAEIRKELTYARDVERGERVRFQHGDSTILIVNIREQATADTAIREIETLFDYHSAKASLDAAMGRYRH